MDSLYYSVDSVLMAWPSVRARIVYGPQPSAGSPLLFYAAIVVALMVLAHVHFRLRASVTDASATPPDEDWAIE